MSPFRILVFSNVRPSRAWRIANRLTREVPGAEICGIVQRPLQQLPLAQQLIINGGAPSSFFSPRVFWNAKVWFHSLVERLAHLALWWVHGCPPHRNDVRKFTIEALAEECARAGWPFLLAPDVNDADVLDCVRQQSVDLAVVLGEPPLGRELLLIPRRGAIQASQSEEAKPKGLHIRVEHLARDVGTPFAIASLTIPPQFYDGLLALTLKADLITDDLLVQTAKNLRVGDTTQASKQTTDWMHRILSPYLTQFEHASGNGVQGEHIRQRCRPTWKLLLETLLLCSPLVVARNWCRRWRGRYPLLILTHHLVTDRVHRMGISTEMFWHQVRFLLRHYRIVGLSEGIELLRSGEMRVPCVALTFDDGYGDNFVSLRAVAEETAIPVALFLPTQPIENHREFQHDLVRGISGFFPLTWEQIRYWNLRGGEFGSHTHSHFDCGYADRSRLEAEIIGSKNILETHLTKPVRFFAFPFGGRRNISSEAMQLAVFTYPHVLSDFGGENLPGIGRSNGHLFRKNFYSNLWELELELQSVFDLVAATQKLSLGRANSSRSSNRLIVASAFNTPRNASSGSRIDAGRHHRSAVQ